MEFTSLVWSFTIVYMLFGVGIAAAYTEIQPKTVVTRLFPNSKTYNDLIAAILVIAMIAFWPVVAGAIWTTSTLRVIIDD